jgi:hypothetical protein
MYNKKPKWGEKGTADCVKSHLVVKKSGEEFVVQPYFLRVTRSFGFLVDFHFRLAEGVQYSRGVQQLSLSLDKHFKRNLDYYVDRISKIQKFVDKRWSILNFIILPGVDKPVELSRDFQTVKADCSTQLMPNIKLAGRLSLAYDILVQALRSCPEDILTENLKEVLKPDFKRDLLYKCRSSQIPGRLVQIINLITSF